MKLGKALSTGYAKDAYEYDTDQQLTAPAAPAAPAERTAPAAPAAPAERTAPAAPADRADRTPDPVKVTAEAAQPRQVVDAAAR